jgi:DNA-directed RNA polymerase specialized sigma24 family protein
VSCARRPQPPASCWRRDDARPIDDVRALGSAVARLSGGEEDAFRSLIEPHRPARYAHCYRMLDSMHDAEDALRITLLRAWRALPTVRGRSSHRTWLYRIATNVCLDAIAHRPKRALLRRQPLHLLRVADLDVPALPLERVVAQVGRRSSTRLPLACRTERKPTTTLYIRSAGSSRGADWGGEVSGLACRLGTTGTSGARWRATAGNQGRRWPLVLARGAPPECARTRSGR